MAVRMWQEVRPIPYAGDGAAAAALAQSLGRDGVLQQIGDLVLLTLDPDASEAAEFAEQCPVALRIRGHDGDQGTGGRD